MYNGSMGTKVDAVESLGNAWAMAQATLETLQAMRTGTETTLGIMQARAKDAEADETPKEIRKAYGRIVGAYKAHKVALDVEIAAKEIEIEALETALEVHRETKATPEAKIKALETVEKAHVEWQGKRAATQAALEATEAMLETAILAGVLEKI